MDVHARTDTGHLGAAYIHTTLVPMELYVALEDLPIQFLPPLKNGVFTRVGVLVWADSRNSTSRSLLQYSTSSPPRRQKYHRSRRGPPAAARVPAGYPSHTTIAGGEAKYCSARAANRGNRDSAALAEHARRPVKWWIRSDAVPVSNTGQHRAPFF